MESKTRLGRLIGGLGVAMMMALLLSGSAGAWEGTPTSQAQSSSAIPQQAAVGSAGNSLTLEQPPLCRYGVTAFDGMTQLKWLPTWRANWTLDFKAHAPLPGVAAEYAQMLRIQQNKSGCTYLDGYSTVPALTEAGIGAVIRAAPDSLWIIGNEPDRGPDPGNCLGPGQDDTYPEVYARAYHDAYTYIKQRDPKARVAIAGLVQVTPGRLQYLDKVWAEYARLYRAPMPVDVWNMHLYILPEAQTNGQPNGIANIALGSDPGSAIRESGGDPNRCSDPLVYCFAEHDDMTIFAQQIVAMRTWLKNHDQQNKPLILSEYSLLYPYERDPDSCFLQDEYKNCFTPERVSTFMANTFNYLESAADPALGYPLDGNRLVQRWMWFSAYASGAGNVSSLLVSTHVRLTLAGENFRDQVAARPATINLFLGQVGATAGHAGVPGGTATVNLYAQVFNNGSVATGTPFPVTFYADQALTQVIGSTVVSEAVDGCVVRPLVAQVTWADLPVGNHPFWVKVDSADSIGETNEGDNIGTGTATVSIFGRFLPLISRQ